MKYLRIITLIGMVSAGAAAVAQAQAPQQAPRPAVASSEYASLKIQVVLSRYQGEKKVSSFPYTFSILSDHSRAELRMGSQIPVSVMVQGTPTTSFKEVGTQINCIAFPAGTGDYKLEMTISDSSLYEDTEKTPARPLGALQPIRSFSSSNTLILRDGQSSQFTTATDRITGEVTKADVTLTVVK